MKTIIVIFAAVFVLCADVVVQAFTVGGFQNPYGVMVDSGGGFIYVSNINGAADAEDDNGYISRLRLDGKIDQIRFIDGAAKDIQLNAPKGMAIAEGRLYVADITKLRAFDLKTGRKLFDVNFGDLPVGHFYDVSTGPDTAFYVTDGPGNIIYRVDVPKQHEVTTLVEGSSLGQPHGIVWLAPKQMFMVSSWGTGQIIALDRSGKRQAVPSISIRTTEGICADTAGNVYTASPSLSAIYKIMTDFALYPFASGLNTPTGVAFDPQGKQIVVTSPDTGAVQSVGIE